MLPCTFKCGLSYVRSHAWAFTCVLSHLCPYVLSPEFQVPLHHERIDPLVEEIDALCMPLCWADNLYLNLRVEEGAREQTYHLFLVSLNMSPSTLALVQVSEHKSS